MRTIHLRCAWLVSVVLVVCCNAAARKANALPPVAATGDTAGAVDPCGTCPDGTAPGGLARRATLLNQLRGEHDGLLTVDAGNAIFGPDSMASQGQVISDTYRLLQYDAVNLSHRDFRLGKERTLALIEATDLPAVTCNILDAGGQSIAEPYRVVVKGESRTAVIGVTQPPPGLQYLPHLKEQLDGLTIADPIVSVRQAIAKAKQAPQSADAIVVLASGSPAFVAELARDFAGEVDLIVTTASPADVAALATAVAVLPTEDEGVSVSLHLQGQRRPRVIPVSAALEPDGALPGARINASSIIDAGALTTSTPVSSEPLRADAPLDGELSVATDPLSDAALQLRVTSATTSRTLGSLSAGEGNTLLSLDVEIENALPLATAMSGRAAGEKVLVAFKQKLFLVVQPEGDAAAVFPALLPTRGRPLPEAALPGQFVLENIGSVGNGEIYFEVPQDLVVAGGGAVELRLYHDDLDRVAVAMRGQTQRGGDDDNAAGTNRLVSLDAPTVSFPDAVDGQAAPAGSKWLRVQLAGRSKLGGKTPESPAGNSPLGGLGGAFDQLKDDDQQAEAGADSPRGAPAIYLRAFDHLQVVADGQWATLPLASAGTLPSEPTFLPDLPTGGSAVFLVPDDATSLVLEAHFPLMDQLPGIGKLKAETIRIPLAGEVVAPPEETAALVVQDEPVPMAIINAVDVGSTYGEFSTDEERTLVLLDVQLRNESDEDGLYALAGRFRGAGVKPLAVLEKTGRVAAEQVVLPARTRRAMRVLLSVPKSAAEAESLAMNFAGVSVNPSFELSLAAGTGTLSPDGMAEGPGSDATGDDDMPGNEDAGEEDVAKPGSVASGDASNALDLPWLQPGSFAEPIVPAQLPAALVDEARRAFAYDDVRFTIQSAELIDEYNGREASDGWQYLQLTARVENLLPGANEEEGEGDPLPPTIKLELAEQLHLVANGRVILPNVARGAEAIAGEFELPNRKQRKAYAAAVEEAEASGEAMPVVPREKVGQLVFHAPIGSLESASLHMLDPVRGNRVIPVFGTPTESSPRASGENEIAVVELHGWTARPTKNGRGNWTDLELDLRGQSLRQSDPAIHDGAATPISHVPGSLAEGRVHLLLDGVHPRHIRDDTPEPFYRTRWRLLPDATVGKRVRIVLPDGLLERAGRIELVVTFDDTPMPGGPIFAPTPIVLTLKDDAPRSLPPAEPLWSVRDDQLLISAARVSMLTEKAQASHHGVRVTLENTSETPVAFTPRQVLQLHKTPGEESAPDRVSPDLMNSSHGQFRLVELDEPWRGTVHVPAGQTRVFEMAFTKKGTQPVMRYSGLLRQMDFPLEPASVAMASPMPMVPETPPEKDAAEDAPPVPLVPVLDPAREIGGIASVGLRPEQVNEAIRKGRAHLWATLQKRIKQGRPIGESTYDIPVLLALVHTEAHEEFPEFNTAIRSYFAGVRPATVRRSTTYNNGLLAMTVAAYGDPTFTPLLEDIARYLVEDQGPKGSWSYGARIPPNFYRLPFVEQGEASAALQVVGNMLPPIEDGTIGDAPMRRRLAWQQNGDGDHSVSQYAVLGLLACEQGGVDIDPEVWRRILRMSWQRQARDGGWGYTGGRAYGSMTGAGGTIAAVAMRMLEPDRDPTEDPRIRRGLAWLATHWIVGENPKSGEEWTIYHMYGVERVGRLLNVEHFGAHEWYPPMAKWLIDQQQAGGSWPRGGDKNEELSTSLALLFLVRATETLDPEQLARERAAKLAEMPTTGRLEMLANASAGQSIVFVLDASGSMREKLDGVMKFEIARDAISDTISAMPDGAPVGLVVYGHRHRAIEEDADTDVEVIVPTGPLDKSAVLSKLAALKPQGKTPLALSLDAAVKAIDRKTEATVVLLTDGGQRREPGDPVASAKAVGAAGHTLQVIGFDIEQAKSRSAKAWSRQLREMAGAAGGKYVPVDKADQLGPALTAASSGSPESYTLLDASGNVVSEGGFGGTLELEPGEYLFRTRFGEQAFEVSVTIVRGFTQTIAFDAGALRQSD